MMGAGTVAELTSWIPSMSAVIGWTNRRVDVGSWQILLQKSYGDASDETMESELRMQRIEVALLQPLAIQSCAPRPQKCFCNME